MKELYHKDKLIPRDIFHGQTPVYIEAMEKLSQASEEQKTLNKPLLEVLNPGKTIYLLRKEELMPEFIDLTITYTVRDSDQSKILEEVPSVRIIFKQSMSPVKKIEGHEP